MRVSLTNNSLDSKRIAQLFYTNSSQTSRSAALLMPPQLDDDSDASSVS
jgi:hypothetical protein